MDNRFSRLSKICGEEQMDMLENSTILILGLGGVGGYVVESLARSGVGNLIIVDNDKVDITNINRQIIALNSTVGMYKTDAFENRIKEINPKCNVIKITDFILEDNIDKLFKFDIDFLVDACDTMTTKKLIIKKCLEKNIKFITSMGTGNKWDPTKLTICDIRKTVNDPLAREIRKYIKNLKTNKKVIALSSTEVPLKTHDRLPGSNAFVPTVAGLLIGNYIVKKLINL